MSEPRIDSGRMAWLRRTIPDIDVRCVITRGSSCDSDRTFALQPGPIDVNRDYNQFAVDLYFHLLETACSLARMAGELRNNLPITDKIKERRANLLFSEGERSDVAGFEFDIVQTRAHLLRAMKALSTIQKRSKNSLLSRLANAVEGHLVEAMPELRNIMPYDVDHLGGAIFAVESDLSQTSMFAG